jgi:membrane-bound lytic murein transglycosylase MltF
MPNCSRLILRPVVWVIVTVLAAACGSGNSAPAPPPAAGVPPPAGAEPEAPLPPAPEDDPVIAAALKKWTGDFDGMVERRVIRVLTTPSKTSFFVDRGTQLGIVVDAFRLFEDDLNKRLNNQHIRVNVMFVPVAHDDLIPALLEGRGDVVAAQTVITAWRGQKVTFTNPTRTGISTVVVTGSGGPPIATVQDLAGKEVYLRESDVSKEAVAKFNAELKAAGKAPVTIRPAPEVLADEDLLEMVNAGLAPMTIVDDYVAEFWRQIFPGLTINTGAAVRTNAETAMMVRPGSPKLLAELNAFIARYPEKSMQRNVLTQKYFKSVKYAKGATAPEDAARFRETVSFIRKYADKYELDYLLMAAQGYQESGLDQRRKSPVGAIGVMQVMPATGKDMNVGDITQLDANVHAGVKYMRFMIDRYYAKEPMDRLNKGLFTFASYNAGPGRVRQLRERAAKRGLDPNKWFNHVEVIAAESIGRETVQYVSNIYKYYLAYKMLTEQQALRRGAKATKGLH